MRNNITGQGLILTTLALMSLGVVMVFSTSAASAADAAWYERTHLRQPIFAAVAVLLLCVLWRMDYHWLGRRGASPRQWVGFIQSPAAVLLVLALAAAVVVLIPRVGYSVGDYRRWLRFGPIGFQPSEVLKIALLVALAVMLGRADAPVRSFRRVFLPAMLLIGVAVGLVVTQDFGTAAIIGAAAVALLLAGGVPWGYVLALAPFCAAGFYFFVVCEPHRWARIEAMLNPAEAANAATYQPAQARIAVGSGAESAGLGGGLAKYGYLPEGSTDFIFASICEELGMIGAVLVIGLLLVWLMLACRAATNAPDRFGALLAASLGFLIAFQSALHIAVNLQWAPPTGVSLPFVSAGGSSLLLMSAATAMIVSVSARANVRKR